MIKLFKLLKVFKWSIITITILIFIQSLTELFLPTLMSDIVDTGIVNGDKEYILDIGIIMLVIAGVGTISSILSSYLSAKTGIGFGKMLRRKLFEKVEKFSLDEFDEIGTASLITRTTNDIVQVQNVLIVLLRMFMRAPLMAIGGVIMAVNKDSKLSLILIVVVIVIASVIAIIASISMPLFKAMQLKLDNLNLVLRERLTGIRVIRAFNKIKVEKQKFKTANTDLTNISIKVNKLMAILNPLMILVINLTTVAIIWFGAFRVDANAMQVGDLMAFIQYVFHIMFAMFMFTMMFILIPRASASAIRINEVLNTEFKIVDIENPKEVDNGKTTLEFKNVTFSYKGAEEPAIKNVSFYAKQGETTAIIGGTGSGKSTIVNLILRFHDISDGKILINGTDIREMSQSNLRKKIGLVPQKSILFTGTVTDNIRFGKSNASIEEIKRVSEIAQANEFINEMELGYDSMISQGGTNISGGQKQRLSIARALIKRPDIYIFDDSFSALDFKTDAKLRQVMKNEIDKSIVVIVAQRITTIMNAEQIIVLDDGKISDIGTHKELMKKSKVYNEIVKSQLSEEEIS